MKLEELLKFHGKIPTGSGDIWILRGLLGHFDPGMSVKVNGNQILKQFSTCYLLLELSNQFCGFILFNNPYLDLDDYWIIELHVLNF